MNDLISRQAAIAVADYTDYVGLSVEDVKKVTDEVVKGLKRLPSAQQWIPCSERLPDLWDEKYLVSFAWGGVGTMEYKSTGFHNYGSFSPVPIETVTAWMPLPPSFKEE